MDFILNLADPWGYLLVFALATGESAAFLGLFLPGEATVILGGVLVYEQRATLPLMIACACGGAIIGDSLGYWIGRRFGRQLKAGRLGRAVGHDRWDKASAYLRRRGGRAVFFGRFIGFLRALIPALAGSAGIRYTTFLPFSVAGGAAWGTAFVFLGVAAGRSYRLVEKWAGRASLILAGIIAVGIGFVFLARKIEENRDAIRARIAKFNERPRIARIRSRFRREIDFLERRFDPNQRFGFFLTFGVVVIGAGAWIFGSLLQDVLAREQLALFDRPAINYLVDHRDPAVNNIMEIVSVLGSTPFLLGLAAAVGGWAYLRTKQWRWPLLLSITLGGAIGLYELVKVLVDRPRPNIAPLVDVTGSSFPSGHATAAAAVFVAVAYVLTRQTSWKAGVFFWMVAAFSATLVAFSRVYLGVHWPTDVLAGLALGGSWTAVCVTAVKVLPAERDRSRQPASSGARRD
jgi:membrane protein DedA with SNARE-associated domain/membrane-associated phospholipid phosphatase